MSSNNDKYGTTNTIAENITILTTKYQEIYRVTTTLDTQVDNLKVTFGILQRDIEHTSSRLTELTTKIDLLSNQVNSLRPLEHRHLEKIVDDVKDKILNFKELCVSNRKGIEAMLSKDQTGLESKMASMEAKFSKLNDDVVNKIDMVSKELTRAVAKVNKHEEFRNTIFNISVKYVAITFSILVAILTTIAKVLGWF